jgi:elongation factor 1-beta
LQQSINAKIVILKALTKMASVIVTFHIMPSNPEIDLSSLETKVKEEIGISVGATEFKTEINPVAFGLKALDVIFVMDESKGDTEELEKKLTTIEGIESVEVTDVRRALG